MAADIYMYEHQNIRLSVMSKDLQESGKSKYRLYSSCEPNEDGYFEEVLFADDETLRGLISVFRQALKDAEMNYEPEPKKEYNRFSDLELI